MPLQVLKLIRYRNLRHVVSVRIVEDVMGPRFKVMLAGKELVDSTCQVSVWKAISNLTGYSRGSASSQLARFCGLTNPIVFKDLLVRIPNLYRILL